MDQRVIWKQFCKNRVGFTALIILGLFFLIGLYAPFLASSKPLLVLWNKKLYFPLFRYLFYCGFYTKPIDLFYNLLMFTLPLTLLGYYLWRSSLVFVMMGLLQIGCFLALLSGIIKDPENNMDLQRLRKAALQSRVSYREDPLLMPPLPYPTWSFDLTYMTPYAKLNLLLRHTIYKKQHEKLLPYATRFAEKWGRAMPTLWSVSTRHDLEKKEQLQHFLAESKTSYYEALDRLPELSAAYLPYSHEYLIAKYEGVQKNEAAAEQVRSALEQAKLNIQRYRDAAAELYFLEEREKWFDKELSHFTVLIPPLLRNFHWEDDAGGAQGINQIVPWWELTRVNRKDLVASLIFGIRISLVVGVSAVCIALLIGIPFGAFSGYFAGKSDLIICRFIEIWEAMPTFFMLLLTVALTQSKSIFLSVAVLGIFGWTSFARFMRAEVLKQRSLPYVLACKSLGYRHPKILFSHILPNAIAPILTLLPFAMMAAITSEAGLAFLGLGEEGSSSWGCVDG